MAKPIKAGTKNYQTVMSTVRNNAIRKLIAKHELEYDRYYEAEAKKAGIYKYSSARTLVLEKQLKNLQMELRVLKLLNQLLFH